MRLESSVTSITWIPSECVEGINKAAFDMGVVHYDEPPPDQIDDLEALRQADRFRFANELHAYIEVEDGRIQGFGHLGRGHIGSTTLRLGPRHMTVAAIALPDLQPAPTETETSVRFVQTAGGRTGLPMPRRVKYPPFIQIQAPLAWATLALTLHADGSEEHELVGASLFPRHFIYDRDGKLVNKTGLIDFKDWWLSAFGTHTPWGHEDSPALMTEIETALERKLSAKIMRAGTKPKIKTIDEGRTLVEQATPGTELFVLLDGVLAVEVDGNSLCHLGPGVVLGERAFLERGLRTSTLRAVTSCRVAAAEPYEIEPHVLSELASGHHRELGQHNLGD